MDEWDRYIEDQEYARSLRWSAESGHINGLMILGVCALSLLIGIAALAGYLIHIIIR